MKKNHYLPCLALFVMINVTPVSMRAAESEIVKKSGLIAKAQSAYHTLKEDMKCLFSRKKSCTYAQKKRIALAAVALAGAVVLLATAGVGISVLQEKRTPEEIGQDNQLLLRMVYNGDLTEVTRLVNAGSSPDLTNQQDSRSLLHIASANGKTDIVKFLLESDAKTDTTDYQEETPLHLAADGNHLEIVKLLVKKDPSVVNKLNQFHHTPLHHAAKNSGIDMVKYLVDNGASVLSKTKLGNLPIDLSSLDEEIKTYLKQKMKEQEQK